MAKRFLVAIFLFSATAFAGERHIIRFNGQVPDSFAGTVAAAGGAIESQHRGSGLALVSGLSDDAAGALARSYSGDAIADFEVQARPDTSNRALPRVPETTSQNASNPTLAAYYPIQWALRAISADIAWAAGRRGSPDVTVAVIDSGIDYTHVDLQGRVDLSRSKSFRPDDDALVAALFPGMHPVTDLYYHGTTVASTISSNAVLAAGVTSNVTLIGVKIFNRYGSGTFGDVLAAMLWAADQGADVANMSLGGWIERPHNAKVLVAAQQAANYAHRTGMLVVVAAGNDRADLDHGKQWMHLFCGTSNVVCASATGPTDGGVWGPWPDVDAFAYFSNYGRSAIDVAAPGGNSGGIVVASCGKTFLWGACVPDWVIGVAGTSYAAPHVSGLAALLVEDIGHGKPSQVKARLIQTADDLGARGTDPQYGKGRINVPRALGLQ